MQQNIPSTGGELCVYLLFSSRIVDEVGHFTLLLGPPSLRFETHNLHQKNSFEEFPNR